MKYLVLLGLILLISTLQAEYGTSHLFSLIGDISEDQNSFTAKWVPQLSAEHSLPPVKLKAEISLSSIYRSEWTEVQRADMDAKLYRYWLSAQTPQSEIRLGLQRISFGTGQILRPLQWFDEVQPWDSSQETKGVSAALYRHNWLNNTNLWLWTILADDTLKGNEYLPSQKNTVEFGGRFQTPSSWGETAITINTRTLDKGKEYRMGWDHRIDGFVGAWTEISASRYLDSDLKDFTASMMLGADYTISIGNGLALVNENMLLMSANERPENMQRQGFISTLMASYPIGLLDKLSFIGTYDWDASTRNGLISINRSYDFWSLDAIIFAGNDVATTIQLKLNYSF